MVTKFKKIEYKVGKRRASDIVVSIANPKKLKHFKGGFGCKIASAAFCVSNQEIDNRAFLNTTGVGSVALSQARSNIIKSFLVRSLRVEFRMEDVKDLERERGETNSATQKSKTALLKKVKQRYSKK